MLTSFTNFVFFLAKLCYYQANNNVQMCKVTMSVLTTDIVKISLSINLNREYGPVNRNKHYSLINEALSGHLTTN